MARELGTSPSGCSHYHNWRCFQGSFLQEMLCFSLASEGAGYPKIATVLPVASCPGRSSCCWRAACCGANTWCRHYGVMETANFAPVVITKTIFKLCFCGEGLFFKQRHRHLPPVTSVLQQKQGNAVWRVSSEEHLTPRDVSIMSPAQQGAQVLPPTAFSDGNAKASMSRAIRFAAWKPSFSFPCGKPRDGNSTWRLCPGWWVLLNCLAMI